MATRSARTTSTIVAQRSRRQPHQETTPLAEIDTEGFPISASSSSIVAVCCRMHRQPQQETTSLAEIDTEGFPISASSSTIVAQRSRRQPHYETTPIRKIARRHADTAPMGMRTLSPSFMIGKSNTVSVLLSGLHASLQFAIHTLLRFF